MTKNNHFFSDKLAFIFDINILFKVVNIFFEKLHIVSIC